MSGRGIGGRARRHGVRPLSAALTHFAVAASGHGAATRTAARLGTLDVATARVAHASASTPREIPEPADATLLVTGSVALWGAVTLRASVRRDARPPRER